MTEYLFLAAVMLPPVCLALGFLYFVSPAQLEHADRADAASH